MMPAAPARDPAFRPRRQPAGYEGPQCRYGDNPCEMTTFWCPYFRDWLCGAMCDDPAAGLQDSDRERATNRSLRVPGVRVAV